jgi:antitoxin MazE
MSGNGMHMKFLVSKWGNSLAMRIPRESAKRIGVREGDTLVAQVSPDGRLLLAPESNVIGSAQARRLRHFLARQKITRPSVSAMRRQERH